MVGRRSRIAGSVRPVRQPGTFAIDDAIVEHEQRRCVLQVLMLQKTGSEGSQLLRTNTDYTQIIRVRR